MIKLCKVRKRVLKITLLFKGLDFHNDNKEILSSPQNLSNVFNLDICKNI